MELALSLTCPGRSPRISRPVASTSTVIDQLEKRVSSVSQFLVERAPWLFSVSDYALVSNPQKCVLAILGTPEFGDAPLPHGFSHGVDVATMP